MKKLFSMLVILTMLFSMVSIPSVSAASEAPTYSGKNYIFEEHFDGYTNGADGKIDISAISGTDTKTKKWYEIGKTNAKLVAGSAGGDNYITASTTRTDGDQDTYMRAPFCKADGSGGVLWLKDNFAVDIAWKRTGTAAGSAKLDMMFNRTALRTRFEISPGGQLNNIYASSTGVTADDSDARISSETDENGFVHARLTFSKATQGDSNSLYRIAIRNMNDDSNDGISLITAASAWGEYTDMQIGGYEKGNEASSWSISEFSAYYVDEFEVVSHVTNGDTHNIIMSDTLNENQSATVNVLVDGNPVECTVSGDTIMLPIADLAEGDHTVSLEGVLSDDDVYCFETFTFNKAAAPVVAPDPVFTMDISAYKASGVVKNAVDGSTDGITVVKKVRDTATETNGPIFLTDYTRKGYEIDYLAFSDGTTTSADYNGYLGSIFLSPELTTELVGTGDEMTVEFWAKMTDGGKDYGRPFTYGNTAGTEMSFQEQSNKFGKIQPISGFEQYNINYDNEKWHYFAISRKWTETDAETKAGTWEVVVFKDGQEVAVNSGQTLPTARNTTANAVLTIGGNRTNGGTVTYNPFAGGIAEFKVYNKMLTADQMETNYLSSSAKYLDTLLAEGVYFTDATGGVIESFDAETATVKAKVAKSDIDAVTIMAIYDADNRIKKVAVADEITLADLEPSTGWKIKCFVFDNIANLAPLFSKDDVKTVYCL